MLRWRWTAMSKAYPPTQGKGHGTPRPFAQDPILRAGGPGYTLTPDFGAKIINKLRPSIPGAFSTSATS